MAPTNGKYFDRADTMFGVCEAVGTEFGFNPNYLRASLGVAIMVVPWAAAAAYVGMGVVVFAAYKLQPNRAVKTVEQPVEAATNDDTETFEFAQAA